MGGHMMFKFELGEVLKDAVTSFTGVCMGRTEYLTGCNHYGLLSQKLKDDGEPRDYNWFDEQRLIITGKKVAINRITIIEVPKQKYGSGPEPNAPSV